MGNIFIIFFLPLPAHKYSSVFYSLPSPPHPPNNWVLRTASPVESVRGCVDTPPLPHRHVSMTRKMCVRTKINAEEKRRHPTAARRKCASDRKTSHCFENLHLKPNPVKTCYRVLVYRQHGPCFYRSYHDRKQPVYRA